MTISCQIDLHVSATKSVSNKKSHLQQQCNWQYEVNLYQKAKTNSLLVMQPFNAHNT